MRKLAIIVPLLALLALALWFAVDSWMSIGGPPMPVYGYLALGGGVIASLLVGCGLMALMFYSSRHGYDDIADHDRSDRRD